MEEWVSYFDEEKYNFSESFKKQLSNQLGQRLINTLEYPNLFKDYFYNLFIGMDDANIMEKDNYVFADAKIISPDSQSRNITICWTSETIDDKLAIHKSEIINSIEFLFCTDLPVEDLKKYIKPKKKRNAGKQNERLEIDVNLDGFPDLVIKFDEKEKLSENEKQEIRSIFTKYENIYVSEFSDNMMMLDFQIDSLNFKQEDFEAVETFINNSLNLITGSKLSSKISRIEIE